MLTRTLIAASLFLTGMSAVPAEASARGWQRSHPARAHINHRIARQQVRITHQVRQGDMSRSEARGLRQDLHGIRKQERAYAQANGNNGHLTRAQARDLNQQLNQTSQLSATDPPGTAPIAAKARRASGGPFAIRAASDKSESLPTPFVPSEVEGPVRAKPRTLCARSPRLRSGTNGVGSNIRWLALIGPIDDYCGG